MNRHVACMREMGNTYKTFVGKPEGEGSVYGRILLKMILRK
jgi:hypothetical protein